MTRGYWVRRWTRGARSAILYPRREPTPPSDFTIARNLGASHATRMVDLRRLLLRPRADRRVSPRVRPVAHRCPRRRPHGHHRVRRDPTPSGGHRSRDRPARGGRIVRPHPVRACRGRSPRTRSSMPSSPSWPMPAARTTSSSRGGARTPASCRRPSSAPGRASPNRPRSCRSATSRTGRRVADRSGHPGPIRRRRRGRIAAGRRLAHARRTSRAGRRRPPDPASASGSPIGSPPCRGIRPDRHARRTADLGGHRHRGDRPVAPDGGRLVRDHAPAAQRRGRRSIVGAVAGLFAAGRRGAGLDRRPDRPAEPALLRRVLRPARATAARGRRGRRADDRHRQVQGPQRHARSRDGRRGPARGRRRDHRGRSRGRRPGPLRRRGVRGPAAQPDAGGRARGR